MHEEAMMLDAARRREYAQLINDSGQHLLSVVNGILDMSKMESGNFELTPEPFAPRAALLNCCNLLALRARENGVDLSADVPQDLPVITGDPRAFKQIVLNLIYQRHQVHRARRQRVTVSATVDGIAADAAVSPTPVSASPPRISSADRRSVLSGRQDLSASSHEGTGLGLSIVKGLVGLAQWRDER